MSSMMHGGSVDDDQHAVVGLTTDQVETYLRDGVLVVDDVLDEQELEAARSGLRRTLMDHGIHECDADAMLNDDNEADLSAVASRISMESIKAFQDLSSTNGSGGVLDVFYVNWKFQIASNPRLWNMTKQLWEAAYCHDGETMEDVGGQSADQAHRWHPYGEHDINKGYMYVDRIGFRLPSCLSDQLGRQMHLRDRSADASEDGRRKINVDPPSSPTQSSNAAKKLQKKLKNQSLQRSLTPHLDCCPDTYNTLPSAFKAPSSSGTEARVPPRNGKLPKWRPIQCFISLSDSTEPNTGGFEAAKGFHRDFDEWRKNRQPAIVTRRVKLTQKQQQQRKKSKGKELERQRQHPSGYERGGGRPRKSDGHGIEAALGANTVLQETTAAATETGDGGEDSGCSQTKVETSRANSSGTDADTTQHAPQPFKVMTNAAGQQIEVHEIPPPCVGEYSHIRPKEDKEVMERVVHIPARAGSAVFWDNRIPHANAYRHDGIQPRSVVYCSFLPDVEINRAYAKDQLAKFHAGMKPTDQWIHMDDREDDKKNEDEDARPQHPSIQNPVDSAGELKVATTATAATATGAGTPRNQSNDQMGAPKQTQLQQRIRLSALGEQLMGIRSW